MLFKSTFNFLDRFVGVIINFMRCFKYIGIVYLFVSVFCYAQDNNTNVTQNTLNNIEMTEGAKEVAKEHKEKLDNLHKSLDEFTKEVDKLNSASNNEIISKIVEEQLKKDEAINSLYIYLLLFLVFILIMSNVYFALKYRGQKIISKNLLDTFENESSKVKDVFKKLQKDINTLTENHKREMSLLKEKVRSPLDHENILKICDQIAYLDMTIYRLKDNDKLSNKLLNSTNKMKEAFFALGYKVDDFIGLPYTDNLDIKANFLEDDSLELGTRIITGATKAQVVYKEKLIQKAELTISQNI